MKTATTALSVLLIFNVGQSHAGGAESELTGTNFWAFQAVQRVAVPSVTRKDWPRNAVDQFILARLEKAELAPSPMADRATLLRRLTYDLHGLPPSPTEIDTFLADTSPDALAKVVDRLLASPRYGERWARHWLDVMRFSESDGYEYDRIRDHAWTYRDFVISSFNADKPYDRFVREQLAGDVSEPVTRDALAATGFLVAGPWDQAANVSASLLIKQRYREEELEDILGTVAQTFLGLTVNCARCHNHKFDPVPQRDYYRMRAVFAGVFHPTDRDRALPLLLPADRKSFDDQMRPLKDRRAEFEKRLIDLDKTATERVKKLWPATESTTRKVTDAERLAAMTDVEKKSREEWIAGRNGLDVELKKIPAPPLAYIVAPRVPEPTHLLVRGEPDKKREPVSPGGLSIVSLPFDLPADAPEAQRRIQFAQWLTRPENPLLARVIVNRVWQHHFGRGLVATPNDFGKMGARPSHPELLDWLASEFIAQGWSLKKLHRHILLSATYSQAGSGPVATRAAASMRRSDPRLKDADNRLLWRFAPRRLEAEAVRDAMLHVSGQINLQMGGPGFRPFTNLTTKGLESEYVPADSPGPEFSRRTIYRTFVQTARDPLLDALDCPDGSTKTPVRGITTTPLQALSLMNGSFTQRQASHFAARLRAEAGADTVAQLRLAWRLAFGRVATAEELREAEVLQKAQGLEQVCWALFNANEFMHVR